MARKPWTDDRRSRYTKKVIHDAYMDLAQEKAAEKISITELCRKAQINRGTFYLHYDVVEDVANEILDEMLERTAAFVRTQEERGDRQRSISDLYFEELTGSSFFRHSILQDVPHFLTLLFSKDPFAETVRETFHKTVSAEGGLSDAEEDLLYRFVIGGIYAVHIGLAQDDTALREKNHFIDRLITTLLRSI